MNIEIKEKSFLSGRIRLIECDALKYPHYEDVERAINNNDALISPWIENLIPTVGKVAIIRRLVNATTKTNEGIITYGAVGTGTTTPGVSDVKLGTEYFRKILATSAYVSNKATYRLYLTTSEGNTTLKEYGLFGEDATGTPDSGTLFEHVAINRIKTSGITLTIESSINIV
jgi:hypothetical protein